MADHGKVVVVESKKQWDELLSSASNIGKTVSVRRCAHQPACINAVLMNLGCSVQIIVDFTATWCGPCRMIGPVFVQYSNEFPTLLFLKVDVDAVQVRYP